MRQYKVDPMDMEDLEITSLAFGGNAVARRFSGKVCFAAGGIPGEKVRVKITEEKKNYSYGTIEEILTPSPHRLPPVCPNLCPGCPYADMDYSTELEWKEKQLESFLVRLKKMRVEKVLPSSPAPERTGWRNKITLHCRNGTAGYAGWDNRTLIRVKECPIASEKINLLLRSGTWEKDLPAEGNLTFRCTEKDGAFFYTDRTDPKKMLTESLGRFGEFTVGMRSFFQINTVMAQRLAERFASTLKETAPARMIELYCGCGVFSVIAAETLSIPCEGIELDPDAVRQATGNAGRHGMDGKCRFYAGDAGKVMHRLYGKKLPPGTLLLADPPRTGLAPNALRAISEALPDFLLYISCGPAALMRDLDLLSGLYRAERTELLDLFPSTAHFETLTLLRRIG